MRFLEHPVYCVKLCVIRKHLLGGFCYIFHKWSNSFVCVCFCWNASEVDIIWTIIYQVAQIFCWSSLSVCVSLVLSASLAVHECTGKGVFGFPLCHDGLNKAILKPCVIRNNHPKGCFIQTSVCMFIQSNLGFIAYY